MRLPLVTAVIPTHNHEHWVCDAVKSVANQDYPRKRIVVVDDGSTDKSTEAVLSILHSVQTPPEQGDVWSAWGRVGSTITMVQRLPVAHGPSFARNLGIAVAKDETDVFAFLDSDDIYEPGKISKSVRVLLTAPDHIGVVYSDYDTLRPDGLRLRQYKEPYSRERLLQECIVNCDSLVTRKALEQCGTFDESLRVCEDFDLWLRISEKFMFSHIPESLVTIRVGQHSSTSQVANATWTSCYNRVFEKLKQRNG